MHGPLGSSLEARMLDMMKDSAKYVALVAGGSGIVGHAVAKELKRQGWAVRTLGSPPSTVLSGRKFCFPGLTPLNAIGGL